MRGYQSGRPGFAMTPAAIFADRTIDGRAKAIYGRVALSDRTETMGQEDALADAAGVSSHKTVRKLLDRLIETGWLYEFRQVRGKERLASVFVVPWDAYEPVEPEVLAMIERDGYSVDHPVVVNGHGGHETPGTDSPVNRTVPTANTAQGTVQMTGGSGTDYRTPPVRITEPSYKKKKNEEGGAQERPPAPTPSASGAQAVPALDIDVSARGSVIREEWTPTPRTVAVARERHPHLDIDAQVERFRNHYLESVDRRGLRYLSADWDRKFQTWLAREEGYRIEREGDRPAASRASSGDDFLATVAEQKEAWARDRFGMSYAEFKEHDIECQRDHGMGYEEYMSQPRAV